MNSKRFWIGLIALLALTALVRSARAQDASPGEPPTVIIPGDATLIVRKVVIGAVPAADWQFTGSFSFSLPAAGGETTIGTSEGTYTVTETAVAGYSAAVSCNSGESGTNSVTVTLSADETATCTFTNTNNGPSNASLYVSPATAATIGGVAATPQDILYRNGPENSWSMVFDGSDVGLTKPIAAFAFDGEGDILLALKANQSLAGLGTVTTWDVVKFIPTSLGSATAGSFAWHIDGSDVGLTTSGEKIDALDVLANGRVLISTVGALAAPQQGGGTLKAQDEDVAAFIPTATGATTSGAWAAYFDGTPVSGLGVEDVAGVSVDKATGNLYIAILGAFNVGGVSGNGKDVLRLTPSGGGYTVAAFWRGGQNGLTPVISGLEVVP